MSSFNLAHRIRELCYCICAYSVRANGGMKRADAFQFNFWLFDFSEQLSGKRISLCTRARKAFAFDALRRTEHPPLLPGINLLSQLFSWQCSHSKNSEKEKEQKKTTFIFHLPLHFNIFPNYTAEEKLFRFSVRRVSL